MPLGICLWFGGSSETYFLSHYFSCVDHTSLEQENSFYRCFCALLCAVDLADTFAISRIVGRDQRHSYAQGYVWRQCRPKLFFKLDTYHDGASADGSYYFGSPAVGVWENYPEKMGEELFIFVGGSGRGLVSILDSYQISGGPLFIAGAGLFSFIFVLVYFQGPGGHVLGRRLTLIFIIVFTLIGSCQAMEYRSQLAHLTRDVLGFYEHIQDKYKGYTFVKFYRSSGQDAALQFGDGWNGHYQFRDLLFQLNPNSYFLNFGWNNYLMSFKDRVFSDNLLDQSSGIIFQGDYSYDLENSLKGSPFTVRLLEKGRLESIYLLTNTTEKQGFILYLTAIHFLEARNLEQALVCALKAKALHFQPQSDVDTFIHTVAPYVQQNVKFNE